MLTKTLLVASAVFGSSYAAGVSALYGQCGGANWSGATECAAGSHCQYQNDYYSQCVAGAASVPSSSHAAPAPPAPTHSSAAAPAPAPTHSSAAAPAPAPTHSSAAAPAPVSTSPARSSPSAVASGGTSFKASFTQYGSGDTFGSGNCQTSTTACGFFTSGFNAAVSQNEFGVGPGAGAGPACGGCWKLTAETDSSGNALSNAGNSIVVEVTNLCPASGNPLCSQTGLTGTNQYGANLNFDLCIQSGANTALFGNSGVGLAIGTAEKVACTSAVGTEQH